MNLRHSKIGTYHLDSLSCEVFWQTLPSPRQGEGIRALRVKRPVDPAGGVENPGAPDRFAASSTEGFPHLLGRARPAHRLHRPSGGLFDKTTTSQLRVRGRPDYGAHRLLRPPLLLRDHRQQGEDAVAGIQLHCHTGALPLFGRAPPHPSHIVQPAIPGDLFLHKLGFSSSSTPKPNLSWKLGGEPDFDKASHTLFRGCGSCGVPRFHTILWRGSYV